MWRSASVALGVLSALLAACGTQSGQSTGPASAATWATGAASSPAALSPSVATSTSAGIPGDGTFAVGSDIKAGTYRTLGAATSDCYWERDKDLSGTVEGIIANGSGTGPAIVQVLS